MTESKFYDLCELVEENGELPSDLANYYPTIKNFKIASVYTPLEELLPAIIYFSSNPYKNDKAISQRSDYVEMVEYCKNILQTIPLEEDEEEEEPADTEGATQFAGESAGDGEKA